MTLKIAIVDDDEMFRQKIETIIRQNMQGKLFLKTYSRPDNLLEDDVTRFDIYILDIEMPGIDGIYTGNELKQENPNIIIIVITAFAEYLDEAMRFHVFRYLSKPIDKFRLFRNLKDALQLYNTTNTKIAIETKQGVYTISSSDIVCVEAQMRKVIVHTTTKDYESIKKTSGG